MPKKMPLPSKPTHRAVLATGDTVDYYGPPFGSHPTHWSFGGADKDGNPDGSPVRIVPVANSYELAHTEGDQELIDSIEEAQDE